MRNFALLLLILLTACAPEKLTTTRKESLEAVLGQKAMVAQNYRLGQITKCDSKDLEKKLSAAPSTNINENLITCEALVTCSDSGLNVYHEWSRQNLQFNIAQVSFATAIRRNLRDMGPYSSQYLSKINGIYFADSNRIYVDSGIPTLLQFCGVLVHEMSHRSDIRLVEDSTPRFDTEISAYYLQTEVVGELAKKSDLTLGNPDMQSIAKNALMTNRESLFHAVMMLFKSPTTQLKASDFDPFAWEQTTTSDALVGNPDIFLAD